MFIDKYPQFGWRRLVDIGHFVITIPVWVPGGVIGWIAVKASFNKSVHRHTPDTGQFTAKLIAEVKIGWTFVDADILRVRPDLGVFEVDRIGVISVVCVEILPTIDPTATASAIGVGR